MAQFKFTAITGQGKTIEGVMEAESLTAAQNQIVRQGQIPIKVVPAQQEASPGSNSLANIFATKVKQPEIILFTKQFRTMLRTGIPIMKTLNILGDQAKNPTLKIALTQMEKEVQEGATLSVVFKRQPHIFSSLYCGLINAGEISGTMPEVLDRVTFILEHEFKVKRDIKSALAYPKMVMFTLFGAFFFLLNFVIPKFVSIFTKVGIDLPMPTKVCLMMYQGMQSYWPIMLGTVISLIVGLKLAIKTEKGAITMDLFLIRLPIVGPLFIKSAMSRFASILAILLSSGVSVLTSFEILSATIGNAAIAQEFNNLAEKMREGHGISNPLRKSQFFPPMVVNMIAIGEESGSLDEMLSQVASHYDEEVEYAVAGLSEAIGPILIVVLTGVVGFFALAIFMPMWDLTKMAK
ncbi:MAG: type II secretion system F family protein [Proteobacteria bacterium]|nr:type II secretion system F family protein [Desulfobulbaceae bacterium]MBU4153845.1 type II secretion system F family protein [Pseudomonadota bacterium]